MINDNGGPAFSGTYSASSDQGRGPVVEMHDKGMSLRDYFAAKAVIGLIENSAGNHEWLAKRAYEMADAMLKERAK